VLDNRGDFAAWRSAVLNDEDLGARLELAIGRSAPKLIEANLTPNDNS
jgi:hypothetical protein